MKQSQGLSLVLIALFLCCGAKMIQRLSGIAVLFLQGQSVSFFLASLFFEILNALDKTRAGQLLLLEPCLGFLVHGTFRSNLDSHSFGLAAKTIDFVS